MAPVTLNGQPGHMACRVANIAAFPGAVFTLGYPEAVGDAAAAHWFGAIRPSWEAREDGTLVSKGEAPGKLSYTLTLTPGEDTVDAYYVLTNLGTRPWKQGMAFNCFQCATPALRDHECVRHLVGLNGAIRHLVELPRAYAPRPAIQLYSVTGAPPGHDIPFVANFRATPADLTLEPWMAIVSRDGKRLAATVSKPGLFLFQNREYSCIHSGCGFGPIAPGETAESRNRVYFVEATPEAWYRRMSDEFLGDGA